MSRPGSGLAAYRRGDRRPELLSCVWLEQPGINNRRLLEFNVGGDQDDRRVLMVRPGPDCRRHLEAGYVG
ncbi:hypothetical protein D3C72_2460980 [compost metagenome]